MKIRVQKRLLGLVMLAGVVSQCAASSTATNISSHQKKGSSVQAPAPDKDKNSFPHVVLTSDSLKVLIYTPDEKAGFYRGARFDWSGMVARVEYRNHVFFGEWVLPHDPKNPEHGIGMAEEFDMETAQGYGDADNDGSFMKIGVGALTKVVPPYNYFMNFAYPIAKAAPWKIVQGKSWVEFSQEFSLGPRGYSYVKRVELDMKAPVVRINHHLTNRGDSVLNTEHYCHNFIRIDDADAGPDYRILFPFTPAVSQETVKNFAGSAEFRDNALVLLAPLVNKALWCQLPAKEGAAMVNGFTVENVTTKAAVEIRGDRAPSKFNFYAATRAICPEPFVTFSLKKGEKTSWTNTLTFKAGY